MYDIAIIGGGVVGALIARELTAYDVNLCIIEKENDVAMGASKANSGIVHAGYDPVPGTLKAKLNVLGSEMMESVARELGVKYRRNGTLVVGYGEKDDSHIKELLIRGTGNGVKGLEVIPGERARELEKNLSSKITSALFVPTGAVVCPYQLTIAAVGNAMDNGAELYLNYQVTDIEKGDVSFVVKASDGRRIETKYVINCAGVYSADIARMIGDNSFTIKPRLGEYMLLDKDCKDMVDMTIFRIPGEKGKGVLATRTVDGNILCGPTSELMDELDDKETTQEGLDFIKEKEKEFFDYVPWDKVITSFAGIRAKGDKNDFVINMPIEGFVNVGAIDSPGLSSAPAIARYVVNLLQESGYALKKNVKFNPRREPIDFFKEMDFEKKQEYIKTHPTYGHMICRCEEVTEGDIIKAIHDNPKARDVDGIKRRTRAGMGRCQGGFCLPSVIEILAKEYRVPYESITKLGGNSVYNYERTKSGGQND